MPGLALKYLRYYLTSVGPHGIHSPYIYELVTKVLHDKKQYQAYAQVENLRKSLLHNPQQLAITDFGAGGSTNRQYTRTVADIARKSAKPPRLAKLLYRLCAWHKPQYMLELGTSLGVSAAYQALGAKPQQFISLEGSESIASVARQNLASLNVPVEIGVGNFDETLAHYLQQFPRLDYVFFDGNHRYEPTMRYFEQCLPLAHNCSMFVFDDIRWSAEMEQAWEEIKKHPQVTVTVDLFFIGLVFFRTTQAKEHFTVRF